jgi:hypothetical protein
MRALPVDARALHHHHLGLELEAPGGELLEAALEGLERAPLDVDAVLALDQGACGDLGLVHVEPDHPSMKGDEFHVPSSLRLR